MAAPPNYTQQLAEIARALRQMPQFHDYSQQLDKIVQALSRPTTPTWAVAILGGATGAVGAIAAQLGRAMFDESRAQQRLRKVLYVDLADMFNAIDGIMSLRDVDDPSHWEWQREQVLGLLSFKSEEYLYKNQDIFMQLPEQGTAQTLYHMFHRVVNEGNSFFVNTHLALRLFATHVGNEGLLERRYFEKYLPWSSRLLERVDFYQKLDAELRERIRRE